LAFWGEQIILGFWFKKKKWKFGVFGICGKYVENGKNLFIEKILMV
jgi:hypothetical protein